MIPKKLYCKVCGKKMRRSQTTQGDKTLIMFTCPTIVKDSPYTKALEHQQEVFELTAKQVATWEGV